MYVHQKFPLHVVDALEKDLDCGQTPLSRRVVLQPRVIRRTIGSGQVTRHVNACQFAALVGAETVSMPDMDDAVATQQAQVPLPTCVVEEPQGECPRQRHRL